MTAAFGAFPPRRSYSIPLPSGRIIDLGERPLVMGILNVTPDSFADAAHLTDTKRAIDVALQMEADGADVIDIGGESTRPGADPLDAREELTRILPVLRGLAGRIRMPISVDTYKSEVARAAIDAGAAIINDVSGLRRDPPLANVVAGADVGLVLMHTRGRSKTMYSEANYSHLMAEVASELRESIDLAIGAGVSLERIVVDPGVGFAKRPIHSYGVLARLSTLAAELDRPILIGPSRKSFMRDALPDRARQDRDWGTAAAVTAAILAGAHIVRVHAVGEMVQVVRVAEEIRRHGLE